MKIESASTSSTAPSRTSSTSTKDALRRLEHLLASLHDPAIAVSGGVDSMTLAVVAHRANPNTTIYHAVSPAVPLRATERVKRYAEQEQWRLELIDAREMDDPEYIANPANRCYYCKTNLYDTICERVSGTVLSGTNLDDLGDYRPGLVAASEHAVTHPFVDTGIDKQTLRAIARHLGLTDLSELPASPCLSSRVETGIEIDSKILPVIDEVESQLWETLQLSLPIKGVRCRVRQSGLAIEVESNQNIDDQADYAIEAVELAANIFDKAGHSSLTNHIIIEPYKRGSAFLIDTVTVHDD